MAKHTIKSIGIFSSAKISGVIYAALGLIIGVIYGLFMILFGAAIMASGSGRNASSGGGIGVAAGLGIMILSPIIYGIIGFIAGALSSLIYNVAAGVIGGLELEIETESTGFLPPPQPVAGGWGQQNPAYDYQDMPR